MKKQKIFKITFCAVMAAMSLVLTFFEVNLPIFNVAMYGLPLVFVSIMYGPGYGLLTGLVCGAIEQIYKGLSIQTFLWIIAPLAWGGLSGLVYYGFKKVFNDDKAYKKIIFYAVAVLVSVFVANVSNSLALAVFGYTKDPITSIATFITYAVGRMLSIPLHVIIYVPLCYLVCDRMKKVMYNFNDEKREDE